MTVPTDLRRCTGWFTCAATGYDSGNNRLIDQSGLAFHMPLVFGSAPTFTNRGSVDCLDLTNQFYFEMHNLIPVLGSVVFKFRTDTSGSAVSLAILNWNASRYPNGDHVAVTPNPVWEDNDYRSIFWLPTSGSLLRATNFVGSDPTVATAFGALPINTWYVVTVAWNMRELAVRMKIGAGTTLMDIMGPPEPAIGTQQMENRMRFGYLKPAAAPITAPQYLAVAQMAFFQDDILVNQPTEAAALVASWA